ncbi:hypothetical protein ACLK19_23250 [Escherichia coli]
MKFSNGEPFDAEAAAESFRAVLDNRRTSRLAEGWQTRLLMLEALSKTELQITLKALLSFPARLALPRPLVYRSLAVKNHETMNRIKTRLAPDRGFCRNQN